LGPSFDAGRGFRGVDGASRLEINGRLTLAAAAAGYPSVYYHPPQREEKSIGARAGGTGRDRRLFSCRFVWFGNERSRSESKDKMALRCVAFRFVSFARWMEGNHTSAYTLSLKSVNVQPQKRLDANLMDLKCPQRL
jgi:hypothetical protein